ncbi:MAG: ATP-binding cassette domain-containing protein [Pseudomonadales bacterium]
MSPTASVALRGLSFEYDCGSAPLFSGLSLPLPRGFTGVVGANGAGKTTLLRIVAGELAPTAGHVQGAADAVYCAQRTDAAPRVLRDFLDDWDAEAFDLRGRLGIEPDYLARWDTLSHGERKRAQIACALWQRPTLLAIDEPTNHIDARARECLIDALHGFGGVGLIVSHDRALLDALCGQCLWLEPPNARTYPGGFSQAREQRRLEREHLIAERSKAVRQHDALQREIVTRRERAAREPIDRSKRALARNDSDARAKINLARVTDGKAGAALRQLHGRAEQARSRLAAAQVDKTYDTGIWISGARSQRDRLFSLGPGAIPLGTARVLRFPRLAMRPADRIAIIGDNGAGKSTLVRHLMGNLNVPPEHVIEMPQEIAPSQAERALEAARALPADRLGQVMSIVSRLGSRPHRLLESHAPSPGEIRKLLLALGILRTPHLIVMDEPTNHLDLPSIEALELALDGCPCGLLLVSHDLRFLDRLTHTTWHIHVDARGDATVICRA